MPADEYGRTLSNYSGARSLLPSNSEIQSLLNSHGIYNRRDMDWYKKFVRFPGADPFNTMTTTKEYLFFTKPDLHLLNVSTGKIANFLKPYTFFVDVCDRYKPVCEQLQSTLNSSGSTTKSKNPFMTILTNSVRSGLDLPGLESENDLETGANVYGTKITYRGNSYTSDQDCSFSLEFEDTKYLEVYMLFKIYDEYCRLKNLGMLELTPPSKSDSSSYDSNTMNNDDSTWINYTRKKILHDQFSIYKFVVAEDGMTIIYWARYVGVFPTGAPRDAFSDMDNDGTQKITVSFKAQFVRDMDPIILSDFNRIAMTSYYSSRADLPLFNTDTKTIDGRWSSMPYIVEEREYNSRGNYVARGNIDTYRMGKYKLLWKE